jgi:hypothetical protein
VVDPAGIIRTRGLARASSLHATADGSLLLAQGLLGDRDSALVTVITPDGTVRPVLYGHDRLGVERLLPLAGDPFAADIVWPADAVEAPDGGLLVTVDWGVQYVPPAQPRLFAVAIRPATRVPRSRLTVALRLTQAAEVQIGIWRRGRRVAAALGQLPAGEAAAAVRAHIPPGLYTVRARATAGGQVAAAEADVLVGGLLPVAFARDFVKSREELFSVFEDAQRSTIACRRVSRRRVECGVTQRRRCAAIVVVRVLADGTLAVSQYSGGRGAAAASDASERPGEPLVPCTRRRSHSGGGTHPRGWKADVRYVPSSENRSHGSSLGAKLRRFCDGTRFSVRVPDRLSPAGVSGSVRDLPPVVALWPVSLTRPSHSSSVIWSLDIGRARTGLNHCPSFRCATITLIHVRWPSLPRRHWRSSKPTYLKNRTGPQR